MRGSRGGPIGAAVLACVVAMTSCTSPSQSVRAGATSASSPMATATSSSAGESDAIATSSSLGEQNVVANPPRQGDKPTLTKADAYAAYKRLGFPDFEAQSGVPVVAQYGRVDDAALGTLRPDGGVDRKIVDRLAWVLTFDHITCSGSGGGGGTADTSATSPASTCRFVLVLDANTGEGLESLEFQP